MRPNIITEVRFRFSVSVVVRFFFPEAYLDLRRISKSAEMGLKLSRERGDVPWRGSVKDGEGEIGQWEDPSRLARGLGVFFRRRCHTVMVGFVRGLAV